MSTLVGSGDWMGDFDGWSVGIHAGRYASPDGFRMAVFDGQEISPSGISLRVELRHECGSVNSFPSEPISSVSMGRMIEVINEHNPRCSLKAAKP